MRKIWEYIDSRDKLGALVLILALTGLGIVFRLALGG